MAQFDPTEERAVEMLDDLELEAVRAETVPHNDKRFEFVLWVLCLRGVAAIERVCQSRGKSRGLDEQEIELAIEEAAARMLLRLSRLDPQPQIHALADQIAAEAVDRAWPSRKRPPRLSTRPPELRLVKGLDKAIETGQVRPNDWEHS